MTPSRPRPRAGEVALRAVVLDFDGTLVETMSGFADIASDIMAARYGVEPLWARRRYLRTSGLPFCQQLEGIFPEDERNRAAAAEFERRKIAGFFREAVEPSVRGALEQLRSMGYRLAISSNNYQELIDQYVDRESLVFDCVLGCRDNFFKGRDHFEHIQRELRLQEPQLLFVGDSLMDARRAEEHGVTFIGKTGTFCRQDFEDAYPGVETIDRVAELPSVLRRREAS